MSCEGVIPGKSLLFAAHRTANLLLAAIVDGILMTGQVVRPREYRVAWLACGRVDSSALVWSSLRVSS